MRSKIILLVVAAGVMAGLLGFVLKVRTARRDAERLANESEPRRAALEAEVRRAEQWLVTTGNEQARLQTALANARAKSAGRVAEPARKPGPAAAPMTALRDALLNDPQLQNLRLAAVQPKLRASYLPLCEQLGLSEAQVAQFLAIVQRRGEQEMDLSAIMETRQLAAGDSAIVTLKQQMADAFRSAQTALLGEEGYRRLETYERSIPAREFVNEFAGAVTVVGNGVTGAQADALTSALAGASAVHARGGVVTTDNIDWDQALAGAAGILSPEQLPVFRNAVLQFRNVSRIRDLAAGK